MKIIGLAVLILFALSSCKQDATEEKTEEKTDTTIIINQEAEAPVQEKETPEKEKDEETTTPPAEKPWKAKMAQYHDVRCRMHAGTPTASDHVDRVVLAKELRDIRETLNKDDKFLFDADFVKAEDMATCPK